MRRAQAWRVLYLWEHNTDSKTLLSAFFHQGACYDVCGKVISKGLKLAAQILQYPATRGIPIEQIDIHSLWSGGTNTGSVGLLRHTDTKNEPLERGDFQRIYIREELACYLAGMTTNMKQNFKFVNVSQNATHDVTEKCLEEDYNINGGGAA